MSKLKYGGGTTPGGWHLQDPRKLALKLYDEQNNLVVIELFAPSYYEPTISVSRIAKLYQNFSKHLHALNITVMIHFVNGNDETVRRLKMKDVIKAYPVDDILWLMTAINNSTDILVPVAEGSNYLIEKEAEKWKGPLAYNGTGRPSMIPPGYKYADYHTQSQTDFGPAGTQTIICTDNGPIINSLASGAKPPHYWNSESVGHYIDQLVLKEHIAGLVLYASGCDVADLTPFVAGMKAFKGKVDRKKATWNYHMLKYFKYVKD